MLLILTCVWNGESRAFARVILKEQIAAAELEPEDHANLDGSAVPAEGSVASELADVDGESRDDDHVDEEHPDTTETLFPERWHQYGSIRGTYLYTGEVFNNAHGGLRTRGATRYRGDVDLVLTADGSALGLPSGGEFFLYGQNTHGETLSEEFVGDTLLYSNIDSSPRRDLMQVSEFWYKHTWDDGQIVKIGKQDAAADFTYADVASDFIQSSFTQTPTVPLPTFPDPGLGIAMFWRVQEHLLLEGGVYDGNADGQRWGFEDGGPRDVLAIAEVTLIDVFVPAELSNNYRVGVWCHSGDHTATYDSSVVFGDNYGAYVTVDQMLFREAPDDAQGLAMFVQYGYAPGDRNELCDYWGGGFVYRGLVDGRDADVTGLGIASGRFNETLWATEGKTAETVIECFYRCNLQRGISVQPDVQYIMNPSGNGRDALVCGVRCSFML